MVFGQLTSYNQNNEAGPLFLTINTQKLTEMDAQIENNKPRAGQIA